MLRLFQLSHPDPLRSEKMDRCKMKRILLLLYLLAIFCRATALIEGLYCGNVDCYDGEWNILHINLLIVSWMLY